MGSHGATRVAGHGGRRRPRSAGTCITPAPSAQFVHFRLVVQKMSLTLEDVARIAHLARIEITPAEAADVQRKLGGIFALIEEMQSVDTTGVEPMAHAEEIVLPLREDAVTEGDRHELFQRGAPQAEHGLYLVPRVIE